MTTLSQTKPVHKGTRKPFEEYARDYVERRLSGMSPGNAALTRDFLAGKRLARRKGSTLTHYAERLAALDQYLAALDFRQAKPEQLREFLLKTGEGLAPTTVEHLAISLKCFYRWLSPDDTLPGAIRKALKIERFQKRAGKRPVTPKEFETLLEATPDPQRKAILWMLRDSGLRISELVSLNIGSVEFHEGGAALLILPEDGERLKTGPRDVAIATATPALKLWLAMHPDSGNRASALFPGFRRWRSGARVPTGSVQNWLARLCRDLGLRQITPHLFRHTKATQYARDRVDPELRRKQLGWSAGTRMLATYTHLVEADLLDQARRDAGLPSGPVGTVVTASDSAMESKIREILARIVLGQAIPPATG